MFYDLAELHDRVNEPSHQHLPECKFTGDTGSVQFLRCLKAELNQIRKELRNAD